MTVGGLPADDLAGFGAALLRAAGVPDDEARLAAADLVAADLDGLPSHGLMLLPMVVARLRAGSVDGASHGRIVSDRGAAIVIDAGHGLGQVVARRAATLAAERAGSTGLAAVAVRNAFHFGAAGLYAGLIAERGAVGIVLCNTRPLMPAPGGAEALVGNNPVAVALPTSGAHPVTVDMGLSASAMGRIRLAAAADRAIPEGWAVDADGRPTTDARAAIAGMLLPAAGPKGFGLAFMVDLLCGGLSGGAVGAAVRPLYGDPAEPYGCSQLFIAVDPGHFADPAAFADLVRGQAERIGASRRAPGVDRVFAPGELAAATRQRNAGACALDIATRDALRRLAQDLDVDASVLWISEVHA